jgi:hypothetical protein
VLLCACLDVVSLLQPSCSAETKKKAAPLAKRVRDPFLLCGRAASPGGVRPRSRLSTLAPPPFGAGLTYEAIKAMEAKEEQLKQVRALLCACVPVAG